MRLIDADALIEVLKDKYLSDCFLTDAGGVIQLLKDTPTIEGNELIAGMISDDYKERFIAEYKQVSIRVKRLEKILDDFYKENLSFKLTDVELLKRQARTMYEYIDILELRAKREGIELD